jgi:hypothetical protein
MNGRRHSDGDFRARIGLRELRARESLIVSMQDMRIFDSPFGWTMFQDPLSRLAEFQKRRAELIFGVWSEEFARASLAAASAHDWLGQFGGRGVEDPYTQMRRAFAMLADQDQPLGLLHEDFVRMERSIAGSLLRGFREPWKQSEVQRVVGDALADNPHVLELVERTALAKWSRGINQVRDLMREMLNGQRPVVDAIRAMLEIHIADPLPDPELREEAEELNAYINEIRSQLPGRPDGSVLTYRCGRIELRKELDSAFEVETALHELLAAAEGPGVSDFERIEVNAQVELALAKRHVAVGDVASALDLSGQTLRRLVAYLDSEAQAYHGLYDIIPRIVQFRFSVLDWHGLDAELFTELRWALDWIWLAPDMSHIREMLEESGLEAEILLLLRDASEEMRESPGFDELIAEIRSVYEGVRPRTTSMAFLLQAVREL